MRSVGYRAVHDRVRSLWGKASQHRCVGLTDRCKGQAEQWAYDHTDPAALTEVQRDSEGYPRARFAFSLWPEFYMPLCRICHKQMDLAKLGRPIRQPPRGQRSRYVPKTAAEWEEWQCVRGSS